MQYHDPVLLRESVDGLNIKPDGVYVDLTFGGGGHSREILSRLGPQGRLLAFDQDEDALANAPDDVRFTLVHENFRFLRRFLKFHGYRQVDGVLGDFGVSSHQFDEAERGFSTRFEAVLDMRMNRQNLLTAREVVNQYEQGELRRLLKEYGELKQAAGMAAQIVAARSAAPLETTEDLKKALQKFLPRHKEQKILAQVYQAIRIEVNQEVEVIREVLLQLPEVIKTGGRLSMISYHSLEDRLVKNFIRSGKFEGDPEKDFFGNIKVPFKKMGGLIIPSAEEIARNNRARSARLRIAERCE